MAFVDPAVAVPVEVEQLLDVARSAHWVTVRRVGVQVDKVDHRILVLDAQALLRLGIAFESHRGGVVGVHPVGLSQLANCRKSEVKNSDFLHFLHFLRLFCLF